MARARRCLSRLTHAIAGVSPGAPPTARTRALCMLTTTVLLGAAPPCVTNRSRFMLASALRAFNIAARTRAATRAARQPSLYRLLYAPRRALAGRRVAPCAYSNGGSHNAATLAAFGVGGDSWNAFGVYEGGPHRTHRQPARTRAALLLYLLSSPYHHAILPRHLVSRSAARYCQQQRAACAGGRYLMTNDCFWRNACYAASPRRLSHPVLLAVSRGGLLTTRHHATPSCCAAGVIFMRAMALALLRGDNNIPGVTQHCSGSATCVAPIFAPAYAYGYKHGRRRRRQHSAWPPCDNAHRVYNTARRASAATYCKRVWRIATPTSGALRGVYSVAASVAAAGASRAHIVNSARVTRRWRLARNALCIATA